MPVYCYKCEDCRTSFEVRHGMFFEGQKCIKCYSSNVFREPNIGSKKSTGTTTATPGKIVDKYIKEAKEEVRAEKQKLKSEEM